MLTLTNRQLLESAKAIRELADMRLPVRTALKLRKMMRLAQDDINDVQELIRTTAKEFAKKDADGKIVHPEVETPDGKRPDTNRIEIDQRKLEEYNRAVEKILDTAVELDFKPVKIEDLVDPGDSPLKMTAALAFTLDWLFAESEG